MKWIHDLNLGIKITSLLLLSIGLFGILSIVLASRTTTNLIGEVGQQRIEQEIILTEAQVIQIQDELQSAASVLVNTPDFISAVENGESNVIRSSVIRTLSTFEFTDLDVVDTAGEKLLSLSEGDQDTVESKEDEMLALAAFGMEQLTIVVAGQDGIPSLEFVAVQPIFNESGAIVGGLLMTREISDELLDSINLGRSGVQLSLVYEDRILATSLDEATVGETDIAFQQRFVAQALQSGAAVNPELVYSPSGIPYTEAYIPLQAEFDAAPTAVIIIRVTNEAIAAFQRNNVRTTAIALLVFAVGTAFFGAIIAYFTITRRIEQLQHAALAISKGHYDQTSAVSGRDEIGSVSLAFDQMAAAVQQREQELLELNQSLEQRIEERVAELNLSAMTLKDSQAELEEAQRQLRQERDRVKNFYSMIDLLIKQLRPVFQHGASREDLSVYMKILDERHEELSRLIRDE